MASRFGILTVCTANICRSPFTELLLKDRLDSGLFEVASAGTRGWDAAPMDADAAAELARFDVDASAFRSRPIDAAAVDMAHLILTATKDHRSEVLGVNPVALRRTFTIKEFAHLVRPVDGATLSDMVTDASLRRSEGPADVDITDPYRGDVALHHSVADQIDTAVRQIADAFNAASIAATR